ncbi:MAG: hypothetical protein ACNA8S_14695 [Deferrisomatales bacterium]
MIKASVATRRRYYLNNTFLRISGFIALVNMWVVFVPGAALCAVFGNKLQTFQLVSSAHGANPFTAGIAFKKGDTFQPTLDIANYQLVVKRTWNDGSVKHAIVSGRVETTANTPLAINVYSEGTPPSGRILTPEDIAAAAPSASVECGAIGTVDLAPLLSAPMRTWISGPEMVEAHYQGNVGLDPTLSVWFHVRLYADGELWVRAIVQNGALGGTNEMKEYVPRVTIGGAVVYDNGGDAIIHYARARWSVDGWVGIPDPAITVAHDTRYLMRTKLVPNYWKMGPSEAALDAQFQTHLPMQNGGWTRSMGAAGFQEQIGLLPRWDALYLNSGGDARAYRAVLANAEALNSYPIVWSDKDTKSPIVLSSWGLWTVFGSRGGGATAVSAGPLGWDVAHHGSGGYLAYLITGDYYYLETMQYQAALCYLVTSSAYGEGTNRLLLPVQTRSVAWANRTVGQLAALGPLDDIVKDFVALLHTSVAHWDRKRQEPGQNRLGYLHVYEWYADGVIAPWQQHFWIQTYGMLYDLEPLPDADMPMLMAVRDNFYRAAVGILGAGGADSYCYANASRYTLKVADQKSDPVQWYDSWGTAWEATHGVVNDACGDVLEGGSAGSPQSASVGYWGNLLPAIAYAAEHGAPGAAAAWRRLTSARNWNVVENSGFADIPIWGIVPRIVIDTPLSVVVPSRPKGVRVVE